MISTQIRDKFSEFWSVLCRHHKEIPNVSLVPNNDPSLLFINAGMCPLVPYLLGEKHPLGPRLYNFQRCVRVEDIEEIGDNRHTTFFEMIGNWSLNNYFKKEQIPWVLELYHERFGLDIDKLYVTVYGGSKEIPVDDISIKAWKKAFKKYGINAKIGDKPSDIYKNFDKNGELIDSKNVYKIFKFSNNWWDRGTKAKGELGGPDSEIFFDLGRDQEQYIDPGPGVNSDNGRFIEIGNSVFMEYILNENLQWVKLATHNIDFGGGYERILMCVQGKRDIFETDLFEPIIKEIEKLSGKKYRNSPEDIYTKHFRVLADHIRGSTFILSEGVYPGNKDQGYILRRLIRRSIRHARYLGLDDTFLSALSMIVINEYCGVYPHLLEKKDFIVSQILQEETKFRKTLINGLKEFKKLLLKNKVFDGKLGFFMYETYGFPIELILEELKESGQHVDVVEITRQFNEEKKKHQKLSRSGAESKFKGGLADQSEKVTALHTTHHILLAVLRKVLGDHVHQRGSNITSERLRIDFSHAEKLTETEINKVENLVNKILKQNYAIERYEMDRNEAEHIGAEMEFGQRYPDRVSVYIIGLKPGVKPTKACSKDYLSAEFCAGPHVNSMSKITKYGQFKIVKQDSVGSGIRRLKAVLEKN